MPDCRPEHFEALVAARNILLVNALLTTVTADLRTGLDAYVDSSAQRLRQVLATGIFSKGFDRW